MNRTFVSLLVRKWRILFGDSTYFSRPEVEVTSEISRTSWTTFSRKLPIQIKFYIDSCYYYLNLIVWNFNYLLYPLSIDYYLLTIMKTFILFLILHSQIIWWFTIDFLNIKHFYNQISKNLIKILFKKKIHSCEIN